MRRIVRVSTARAMSARGSWDWRAVVAHWRASSTSWGAMSSISRSTLHVYSSAALAGRRSR